MNLWDGEPWIHEMVNHEFIRWWTINVWDGEPSIYEMLNHETMRWQTMILWDGESRITILISISHNEDEDDDGHLFQLSYLHKRTDNNGGLYSHKYHHHHHHQVSPPHWRSNALSLQHACPATSLCIHASFPIFTSCCPSTATLSFSCKLPRIHFFLSIHHSYDLCLLQASLPLIAPSSPLPMGLYLCIWPKYLNCLTLTSKWLFHTMEQYNSGHQWIIFTSILCPVLHLSTTGSLHRRFIFQQ